MSQTYAFSPLATVAKTVPPQGTRLARVIVKDAAKTARLTGSFGAFVPVMSNSVVQTAITNDSVLDGVRGYLEGIQNQVIRGLIDSGKPISDEAIGIEAIGEWIGANEESSIRLSAESVGKWFDDVACAHIQSMILIQRGLTVEQSIEIAKNYRVHYLNAAKKDYSFANLELERKVKATVEYVAEKLMEEDTFGMKVLTKLAGFKVASNDTEGL